MLKNLNEILSMNINRLNYCDQTMEKPLTQHISIRTVLRLI